MFDIRKANRWRFPRVQYTNFKKEYPNMRCFYGLFSFERRWSGKIWNFGIYHHQISLDFRLSFLDDMVFPNASKQDRTAVNNAIQATK